MKLEVGKYYKRRDGQIVGPTLCNSCDDYDDYPWKIGNDDYPDSGTYFLDAQNHRMDLLECVPNPNETRPPLGTDKDFDRAMIARPDPQAAEIERLKAELKESKGTILTGQLVDTLRARVEELEADLEDSYSTKEFESLMSERDYLNARVDEIHNVNKFFNAELTKAHKERDELRTQLEAAQAKLATYEPKVVKQTWMNTYPDGDAYEYKNYELAKNSLSPKDQGVVLRWDHYSDGSVKAVLEPIEGGK